MAEPNYYELIGVVPDASLSEIRANFRTKVLSEHPDKGGDPAKFQLLNKAYNILTDASKRARYDATGRSEATAEEEFARSFGGGRLAAKQRSKDADAAAVVNVSERIRQPGQSEHEDGFSEWLRQRDQSEMVMTDKDFMKNALFNAAEMSSKVNHTGPVQHVLGSPKTDSYGQAMSGPVQVQAKPRPIKKTIDHDEILVRMLAVPLDDNMVYSELTKGGVCLGSTGVGRIEQAGSRVEDLHQEDAVLVLPKPTKFSQQRPIGSARTLLICHEEDVIKIPSSVLEELTPEQICLAPTICSAYILLENYGAKLKPGDSVLLNAAHKSAAGSALLQLCKLLKLKPICLLDLPGAPKNLVKGEYGSKNAFQDADSKAVAPPSVRQHFERTSEWMKSYGAEEVFPDAVALLKWRDRNQRLLPKLALDGIATKESTEQLIHCLQAGDKDSQCVVYGHGVSQAIQVNPPLLAAWQGTLLGFTVNRWVHSLQANQTKLMAILENLTKLIRANKFSLDTVLYKVGEDAITDAFSRSADASEGSQVVLIFPTLQEEMQNEHSGETYSKPSQAHRAQEPAKNDQLAERERLKAEWLSLLFTSGSVAASSPEGPLPISMEAGNMTSPKSLIVWMGDNSRSENAILRSIQTSIASAGLLCLSWSEHPAGEGLSELNLNSPEVTEGTWYLRDRESFENEDLDQLHDIEILSRSMVEVIQLKLAQLKLTWKNVILAGFGKGAGIAFYASMMKLVPQPVAGGIFFNAIIPFPLYVADSPHAGKRAPGNPTKFFTMWGSLDKSTPGSYRQLLVQTTRKFPDVQFTPDTLPDNGHVFDEKSMKAMLSLLPLVLPR